MANSCCLESRLWRSSILQCSLNFSQYSLLLLLLLLLAPKALRTSLWPISGLITFPEYFLTVNSTGNVIGVSVPPCANPNACANIYNSLVFTIGNLTLAAISTYADDYQPVSILKWNSSSQNSSLDRFEDFQVLPSSGKVSTSIALVNGQWHLLAVSDTIGQSTMYVWNGSGSMFVPTVQEGFFEDMRGQGSTFFQIGQSTFLAYAFGDSSGPGWRGRDNIGIYRVSNSSDQFQFLTYIDTSGYGQTFMLGFGAYDYEGTAPVGFLLFRLDDLITIYRWRSVCPITPSPAPGGDSASSQFPEWAGVTLVAVVGVVLVAAAVGISVHCYRKKHRLAHLRGAGETIPLFS